MKTVWLTTLMFLSTVSVGNAISINFDNGTDGVAVGAFYSGLGVTFSNTKWTGNFGLAGTSGPLGISSISDDFQPVVGDPLKAVFSSGVSSVSITAVDVGERGARIDAYDAAAGGNLVDFDQAFGPDIGVGFFFQLNAGPATIRRIEMYQPNPISSSDGMLWDNMSFQLVPEPTTGVLLSVGLVGLAGFKRRPRHRGF